MIYWEALGEALSLCADAGVDPAAAIEIMKESSGGANVLRTRAPKILAALRAEADPEIGFDIDGMRKDLRTMIAVAATSGRRLPVAEEALRCYDDAYAAGWGARDASALSVFRVSRTPSEPG